MARGIRPTEAPPADSLAGIRGTLGLEKAAAHPRFRLAWPITAAAGWAAALIAFLVARDPHEPAAASPGDRAAPPSEPCMRISRTRLSGRRFAPRG